jgi:hypothetical protein
MSGRRERPAAGPLRVFVSVGGRHPGGAVYETYLVE